MELACTQLAELADWHREAGQLPLQSPGWSRSGEVRQVLDQIIAGAHKELVAAEETDYALFAQRRWCSSQIFSEREGDAGQMATRVASRGGLLLSCGVFLEEATL